MGAMTNCVRDAQQGFTLIELMTALVLASIVALAVTAVLFDSVRFGEELTSQVNLNRQAREMFDLLALGGRQNCTNVNSSATGCTAPYPTLNSDDTGSNDVGTAQNHVYSFGLRGRNPAISTASSGVALIDNGTGLIKNLMARDGSATPVRLYRLQLPPAAATRNSSTAGEPPDFTLLSARSQSIAVTCTSADTTELVGEPVQGCSEAGATVTVTGYLRADPNLATAGFDQTKSVVLDLYDPVRVSGRTPAPTLGTSTRYWNAFTSNLVTP